MRPRLRAVCLAAAATVVGLATSRGRGRTLDHRVFHAVNADRGRAVDLAFGSVTELGSIWAQVGAFAALAGSGRPGTARRALGAAAATWSLGQALKRVWMRPRPYDEFVPGTSRLLIGKPNGTSWPSSHPAVLASFLTVAARDLDLGPGSRASLGALAGVVGASRVALGVHFPSDVLSGLLYGRAVGLLWAETAGPSPAPRQTGR